MAPKTTDNRQRMKWLAVQVCVFTACLLVTLFAANSVQADHPLKLLHYWTGSLSGGIDDMVAEYNANSPASPIVAEGMDHESFKSGIKGLLASGQRPQFFSYWAGARTQAMVDSGYLAPIDEAWQAARLDEVFPKAIADGCIYNGKKYALPVTQHLVGFFYDKMLFERLGLLPPRTWDDFLVVCKELKAAGVVPIALGNRERWPAQFWFDYLLLRTAGPAYRDRLMLGHASYLDPEVKRVFALWQTLISNGYIAKTTALKDWSGAADEVRQGKAAMTLMGTWIIGYYEEQQGWKQLEDYDFFEFPLVSSEVPTVSLGPIDVLVMTKDTGHPHGLNEVIAFFAGVKSQEVMSVGSGALAPSSKVPHEFYSPLKRRLVDVVQHSEAWRYNYDLAVPPAAAEVGLGLFAAFLRQNQNLPALLKSVQQRMEVIYSQR
ncbi:extracellular solute-binding protein [Desulfovibrio mangrovi]|uniref:ABC transporter substrate-binding protein n=1 Tax=Desulfovibrio mangrovi TaxID=2976983 RepID=UPI002245814F|nr:extracellular solute-binding protein [Desulfovibrio mangrovi]UZP68099.1 extracellular solute-binding protein [Desulfovibrio mangrovi]